MARNIADISGTSVISSNGWAPLAMSTASRTVVARMITPSRTSVDRMRQTRKP